MEKLGIELTLLLTQLINFTIIVFILSKILYKPILKVLEERKNRIEEGLAYSEKAKKDQQDWDKKKSEMLASVKEEAKVIIEQAREDGKKAKEQYLIEARQEAIQMKNKLEKEYKTRQQELSTQIATHTVEIAAEMVKKLLPQVMDDKIHHKLIINMLQKIEKTHGKS